MTHGSSSGMPELRLTSASFPDGGEIPRRHTCDGDDLSPSLAWDDPPAGTRSFALVMDDPDAPAHTWVHWVVYNLPAGTRGLEEGVPADRELPSGARQGRNDFKRIGYGGPCPPHGPAHRYYVRVYALDTLLTLEAGARPGEVERGMTGHVLARGETSGRYRRA